MKLLVYGLTGMDEVSTDPFVLGAWFLKKTKYKNVICCLKSGLHALIPFYKSF